MSIEDKAKEIIRVFQEHGIQPADIDMDELAKILKNMSDK